MSEKSGQCGQSMTEFVIIAPFLILIVMGTLQFAFIYNAKATVNFATFQAARTGAVNQGKLTQIERAFARNMAALYTNSDNIAALQKARERVDKEITDGFVCMQRINPPEAAFLDHSLTSGEIPNDNLMFRDPTVGLNSGLSIQDANLLKIRVTYCFEMIVPFVNRTIAAMATASDTDDDAYGFVADKAEVRFRPSGGFQKQCYKEQRIPIVAQAIVRMQSAAVTDGGFATSCD